MIDSKPKTIRELEALGQRLADARAEVDAAAATATAGAIEAVEAGHTIAEAVEAAGISRQHYYNAVRGRSSGDPDDRIELRDAAQVAGVSTRELMRMIDAGDLAATKEGFGRVTVRRGDAAGLRT